MVTVLVTIAETSYIGKLGTAQLAAMALVFPLVMLTQMMSAGAMGGGVSSAISRALGAGEKERASVLAFHAFAIAALVGLFYGIFFLLFGPTAYRLLGGKGEVLEHAIGYSNILFLGSLFIWLMNGLAAVLRGTGDMRVPSITILVVSLVQVVLSGALGLGLGPIPRLGMPGIAAGAVIAVGAGCLFLMWYLLKGKGVLRLRITGAALSWPMFADILKVGALSCLSPLQLVLAVLIFTGLLAQLGVTPLAGYGVGQRLEFLLVPIAFGIGVAAVPMVGMAIGSGDVARARKVAWIAACVSALNLGVIGMVAALYPSLWADLFTADPLVRAVAYEYLRWAGPAFAFLGFGMTLYFASQGSGKVLGPVLASTVRLIVVACAGWWLATQGSPAWMYFALVGAGMAAYGVATALAVYVTPWGRIR